MHKDIKPKKVLVTNDGQIKLVDFGFSKWESLNRLQVLSGTPFYLAPEVLKGIKNTKSDIWSIGVIMYALLSGHLPFVSDTDDTVFHKAIAGDFSFNQAIWENVSDDAKDLIKKMICANLSKRYTAQQWLQHEWFSQKDDEFINDSGIQHTNEDLVSNLKLIRSKTIMQNVAYEFVKKTMDDSDLEKLHEKFAEVWNESEEVSILDFKKVIASFSSDFTQEQIDQLVRDIQKTQSLTGKINYVNLLAELDSMSEYKNDTKMWMTYNKFADNETGLLKYKDLQQALNKFKIDKSYEELKEIWTILKIPEKEDIDFEQFKDIISYKNRS